MADSRPSAGLPAQDEGLGVQLRASCGDVGCKFARTNLGAAIQCLCDSRDNQHEQCRQEPHPVVGRVVPLSPPDPVKTSTLQKWLKSLRTDKSFV